MFNVLTKDYTNFQQISFFDTFRLSSLKNQKKASKIIYGLGNASKVEDLKKNLLKIQDSITVYSESLKNATPFSQLSVAKKLRYIAIKIVNFFKCTNYKINTLNSSFRVLSDVLEDASKDLAYYEELDKTSYSSANPAVQLKLRKMILLHREFKKVNLNEKAWDETAHEVHEYIINKFKQLIDGNNVAIQPEFYHSTKEFFFDKIVKEKTISKSRHGAHGSGVYLSTNVEFQEYGPYAFAIDPEAQNLQANAKCFPLGAADVHGCLGKYESVWFCLDDKIDLSSEAIPCITVDTSPNRASLARRVEAAGLKGIPVVTRKACCRISDLFEKVIALPNPAILKIPNNWTVMVKNASGAPPNPRMLTKKRSI